VEACESDFEALALLPSLRNSLSVHPPKKTGFTDDSTDEVSNLSLKARLFMRPFMVEMHRAQKMAVRLESVKLMRQLEMEGRGWL
jgi:hypothetical protein